MAHAMDTGSPSTVMLKKKTKKNNQYNIKVTKQRMNKRH
jgi:hypothetical protein